MTQEPEDAIQWWPARVGNRDHPFGNVPAGALLCATCCRMNANTAFPFRVEDRFRPGCVTEIAAGEHLALLAASAAGHRIRTLANGWYGEFGMAVTMVKGTAYCAVHVLEPEAYR